MTDISAPYRFVPLSNLVVLPDWAEQVSHDVPFEDGICGELQVSMTTHGSVCVGGQQEPSTNNTAGKVYFYRNPNGKLAIPATSLKGMLRNVIEIASFSKFNQIEDQHLGVRDISPAGSFYTQEIIRTPVQTGWLTFEDNQWKIYPCQFVRVHQKQIIDYFGINYQDWTKLKTSVERYKGKLGTTPTVKFALQNEVKNGKELADLTKNGDKQGRLVVTGQPGKFFDIRDIYKPKSAKKYEFIFHSISEQAIDIPSDVMSTFRQIHEDTAEWKFWRASLENSSDNNPQRIPVFYHKNNTGISSMGLAMMYKLAYKNSLHDAIEHTSKQHIKDQKTDLADLLFGYIQNEGDNHTALKGRVNITMAEIKNNIDTQWSPEIVLSSPHPTFYPAYIRQGNKKDFNQLMQDKSELAGWKRYQVKDTDFPHLSEKTARNKKVQVQLEMVNKDCEFITKIRFHNLRAVELGALLWGLDFGGNLECCHSIGTGKPYGLGKVKLQVTDSLLRRNNGISVANNDLFLQGCRIEFESFMNYALKEHGIDQDWLETDNLKALLEYATDVGDSDGYGYLSDPKDFVKLKKERLSDISHIFHNYEPTKLQHADSIQEISYQNNMDTSINEAEKRLQKLQEKMQKEVQKANASKEDLILIELEDFIPSSKEQVTKTVKNSANKKFNTPFNELWEVFTQEQKAKFVELANKADETIDNNGLRNTVKKINKAWQDFNEGA